jgi:hypothetical protein
VIILADKIISPTAIVALKEALTNAYWYRKDLRSFLTLCISNTNILARLNWEDFKRNIVSNLIDYMAENQKTYQKDILILMSELVRMEDFSHLERLDDGKEKAKKAKESILALKKLYFTHSEVIEEQKKVKERRERANQSIQKNKAINEKLDELRNEYFHLINPNNNPQARGYQFEKILKELFELFDLDPKASFRLVGEQIDGAFSFQNTEFLLEAKWQKEPSSIQHLDGFSSKIARKLENTLGLFISVNGYSKDAITAHSYGKKSIILMDGMDIMAVLEKRIDLVELLSIKKRKASQTGNIYFTVNEILV